MNLAHILEDSARFFPDRTFVLENEKKLTYAEMNQLSDRVAGALLASGLKPGQRVAVCLPNSSEWLAVYFGALKAGCAIVTPGIAMTGPELVPLLVECRPELLVTTEEKFRQLRDCDEEWPVRLVVAPSGDLSWQAFLELAGDGGFKSIERDRSDLAAVLFTGGTTGIPKGVMLSHQNLLASAHTIARQERSTEADRVLCFLPLNHVFGQVHVMLSTVLTAGSLVLMPAFDLEEVLHSLEHLEVTKFYAVPTIYVRLLGQKDIGKLLGKVRYTFSAAASMALELVREWRKKTGLAIHEAYGMTESAAMVTYNHYYRHKVGSVGTPVGAVEVAIMDPMGEPVEQGQEGEICIQGPNIMQGYLNRPEETKDAFWGPWFRSGDIGLIDEEGYVFIVDRLKDMIITGGENVYPREVEELLYELPQVDECSVVGLPDREYGERVTAVIKLKPGAELEPDKIKEFLRARLAPFKVPKAFKVLKDLPKSATGKLLKRTLRRQLMA